MCVCVVMVVLVASVMVVVNVMCICMCGNGGGGWRVSIFRSFLPCPPGKQAHPLDVNRRGDSGVLVSELFYFNSIKQKRSGSSSPFFKSNPGGRLKGGGCHQLRSTLSPQIIGLCATFWPTSQSDECPHIMVLVTCLCLCRCLYTCPRVVVS